MAHDEGAADDSNRPRHPPQYRPGLVQSVHHFRFFAGPLDGCVLTMPVKEAPEFMLLEGQDGFYELDAGAGFLNHQYGWTAPLRSRKQ
jgi:hypothetical protein